ncbi:hypothetical protein OG949_17265 [Streptomyces scopuliridis]|uniref:hypothetical protein n=1 Tax=Streptomyces scopuliridis TaxID=452529 RepID=UPI002DDBEA9A|nr:hypothetical protein [Streptomyces scopuliridis]WSB34451.1 hypothetical protein OG949_17265 [Streptomyces scopuliridis]
MTHVTRGLVTTGLVAAADRLITPPPGVTYAVSPGLRARAAAILLRMALEQALDDFWLGVTPRMTRKSRSRMLCLEWYVRPSVARQCYAVWAALSEACHHHRYELPPTPAEARAWHQDVSELLRVLPTARL